MFWTGRSAANLLPLSVERVNLTDALREWVYEGHVKDYETPTGTCQLCEHPDLR